MVVSSSLPVCVLGIQLLDDDDDDGSGDDDDDDDHNDVLFEFQETKYARFKLYGEKRTIEN